MRVVCFVSGGADASDLERGNIQLLRRHWMEIEMGWIKMIVLVARGRRCVGWVGQCAVDKFGY